MRICLALTFFIMISSGCGVKTFPKSNILELRPEIPFKSGDFQVEKKLSNPVSSATPLSTTEKEPDEPIHSPSQPSQNSNRRMDRTGNSL